MAHAYTPGLQIKDRIKCRVQRLLPISGDVIVSKGDHVEAQTVVARSEQPGDIFPVNLANMLALPPGEVPSAMHVSLGTAVEQGDELAESKGIFGFFKQKFNSPANGTIESVSNVTGQVIIRGAPIPVEVTAFVKGTVVEIVPGEGAIVETTAAFMQGIFGIGGEAFGEVHLAVDSPDADLTPASLNESMRGKVVVGGSRIHGDTVARARELGISAIISGGIDDQDLKEILGYDLGVAITGTENLGITLIITEGFGEIAMANTTFALLKSLNGKLASVNGATQIRAGVMRPEIVVPIEEDKSISETAAKVGGGVLAVGSPVRLIRDPYFGRLGNVTALPSEPQVLESGSKARVLEVNCANGESVTVPRANVEIIAE